MITDTFLLFGTLSMQTVLLLFIGRYSISSYGLWFIKVFCYYNVNPQMLFYIFPQTCIPQKFFQHYSKNANSNAHINSQSNANTQLSTHLYISQQYPIIHQFFLDQIFLFCYTNTYNLFLPYQILVFLPCCEVLSEHDAGINYPNSILILNCCYDYYVEHLLQEHCCQLQSQVLYYQYFCLLKYIVINQASENFYFCLWLTSLFLIIFILYYYYYQKIKYHLFILFLIHISIKFKFFLPKKLLSCILLLYFLFFLQYF